MKLDAVIPRRYTTTQSTSPAPPEAGLPYLIDGHNLIAALPDLSLQDPEDEQKLIKRMHDFCSRSRHKAIIFFDQGHVAGRPFRSGAWLQIRFVRPPRTADDAIRVELDRIGREAPNWIVVTSDREIQAAARQAGAKFISSPDFIRQLDAGKGSGDASKPERTLDPDELEQWMLLFGGDDRETDDQGH
jgi:predicted RNA-binding protein with PIN domain